MDSHPPPPPSTLARATLHHHRQQPPEPPPDPTTQRLSLPFPTRLLYAGIASSTVGLLLGTSQGGTTSALRFRAENSHRLPSSERGWYLYHKSKNYYVAVQSFKEGVGMAGRLTVWAAVFYAVEEVVDRGRVGRVYIEGRERFWRADTRRRKDVLSTTTAGCATAGVFSVWNRLPWITAARMIKMGAACGLMYGLLQDLDTELRGQRLGYVDWVRRTTGLRLGVRDEIT